MARIHRVQKSQKVHQCSKGHEIAKGEPYTWAKPGFRRRTPIVRCAKHPFRPSELMTGAKAEPTAAVEAFDDAVAEGFESVEDLEAAWDELRQAVEEYRDNRQYALEQWEHGNSQLEEYLETAEQALQDVESHTIEGFDDPDESEFEAEEEAGTTDLIYDDWVTERREQHIQEQADEAQSVAGGLEF